MGLFSSIGSILGTAIGGPAGGAIGGTAGGFLDGNNGGSALDFVGGERSNRATASSTREQMVFQERMSNTAHQREVKDLREAGLNPILSAKYGGSSTPSGSSYTAANTLSPAVSTALSTRRLAADLENLRETNAKIKSDTDLNKILSRKAAIDSLVSLNSAKNLETDNTLKKLSIAGALNQSKFESDLGESRPIVQFLKSIFK